MCISRAVVCRRRSISFNPVVPVSTARGLVSTQGDGTCANAAVQKSVSARSTHDRAVTRRNLASRSELRTPVHAEIAPTACSAIRKDHQFSVKAWNSMPIHTEYTRRPRFASRSSPFDYSPSIASITLTLFRQAICIKC